MKIFRIPLVVALFALSGQIFSASAQTLTYLHIFAGGTTDGDFPLGALVQGGDGNFYGTTEFGGTSSSGTVFRVSASGGGYTIVHSFTNSPDGNIPMAGLVLGTDGNLYGTTSAGGTGMICDGGCGTIFRISPSGMYTTMWSFTAYPVDGSAPFGALVEGGDTNFYGTTYGGGTNFEGTVFRFSPSGVVTTLHMFGDSSVDGDTPHDSLVLGSDGNFYGTTYSGGSNQYGTVFQISPSGIYTSLYSFADLPTDGYNPVAGLVEGVDSNFYGTTIYGGVGGVGLNDGTIFRVSPSGTYTSLYSFAGYPGGALPEAGLTLGVDSNFYGVTVSGGGGTGGLGTVFRFTPSGVETTLYTFIGGPTNGSAPYATLVLGSDGDFYGTTVGGGPANAGTIFKIAVGSGSGGGGTNCQFAIGSPSELFAAAGGSGSVSVSASNGCAWTAASNDGFITITSGSSGSGDGTVHYSVAANASTNTLTGTLTIAGQTFTVTQSGAPTETCTFTLSAASVSLTSKGGSKNVSVKTKSTDCAWTAVSNDSFITISAGASSTGNGKVDFTVLGNTNTTALSGTLTIAGQTFTVTQATGGCTFKLSPKDGKLKATGGTGIVKVTPNLGDCDWTAVSNDSFITITVGASGTGKGSVSYTVMPNTNTMALTGTMTIAGQTLVWVTEAAAK